MSSFIGEIRKIVDLLEFEENHIATITDQYEQVKAIAAYTDKIKEAKKDINSEMRFSVRYLNEIIKSKRKV